MYIYIYIYISPRSTERACGRAVRASALLMLRIRTCARLKAPVATAASIHG